MTVLNEGEFEHPLTDKWMTLINSFALRYNLSVLDLVQESYLLEWRMIDKTFESDLHKSNYFRQSLYRQLYRRVNGWGIYEPPPEKHKVCFGSDNINEVLDSIIKMRPFDEVYYEELVNHTAVLLAEKSALAAELFLDRMNLQLQWKELRLNQYKKVPHNKFYNAIKLIKSVVSQEVCFA